MQACSRCWHNTAWHELLRCDTVCGVHQQLARDEHDEAARMGRLRVNGADLVLTRLAPAHSAVNPLMLILAYHERRALILRRTRTIQ